MDTKQQHTAEPWKFRKAKTVTHIFNAARPIAKIGSGHVENPQDESNARRIVACVNACAGIDTVQLEVLDIKGAIDGADKDRSERNSLMAAVLDCIDALKVHGPDTWALKQALDTLDGIVKHHDRL